MITRCSHFYDGMPRDIIIWFYSQRTSTCLSHRISTLCALRRNCLTGLVEVRCWLGTWLKWNFCRNSQKDPWMSTESWLRLWYTVWQAQVSLWTFENSVFSDPPPIPLQAISSESVDDRGIESNNWWKIVYPTSLSWTPFPVVLMIPYQ